MRSQLLSFSCALISISLIWDVEASCYYPDGTFPEDYVYAACSGDELTSCCILSEGDQCLSNGLCYSPGSDYMFRGGCTDKSWNNPNCFQHCKTGSIDSSYDQLVPCGGDRYCCYSDGSTCCNDDSKVFTVASASVIADFASTASYTVPIIAATETANGGIYTTSSDAEPTSAESGEAKPTGSRATNTAVAATATSSTEQQGKTEKESKGSSKIPLIAGAIGGVVILIAAVALVWFLVRRRYRKKLAAGSNGQAFPMSSDGFQRLPDKSPRPIEVPAPMHSPAPPYQPPAYQTPPPQHNAVEIGNSYLPPGRNQSGQPVYEAPAQPYRQF